MEISPRTKWQLLTCVRIGFPLIIEGGVCATTNSLHLSLPQESLIPVIIGFALGTTANVRMIYSGVKDYVQANKVGFDRPIFTKLSHQNPRRDR